MQTSYCKGSELDYYRNDPNVSMLVRCTPLTKLHFEQVSSYAALCTLGDPHDQCGAPPELAAALPVPPLLWDGAGVVGEGVAACVVGAGVAAAVVGAGVAAGVAAAVVGAGVAAAVAAAVVGAGVATGVATPAAAVGLVVAGAAVVGDGVATAQRRTSGSWNHSSEHAWSKRSNSGMRNLVFAPMSRSACAAGLHCSKGR